MEGKDKAIEQFPAVVNAIQGLQSQLANDESFSFKFGAVLTFNESECQEDPICKLTPDYMEFLDFLSDKARNAEKLKPVYGRFGSWSGVRTGVELFNKCRDESNVLVVVGDKGSTANGRIPPWWTGWWRITAGCWGSSFTAENRTTSTISCCKSGT